MHVCNVRSLLSVPIERAWATIATLVVGPNLYRFGDTVRTGLKVENRQFVVRTYPSQI